MAGDALSARTRQVALWTAGAAVVAALLMPRAPVLGPPYTASRGHATRVADSLLLANGTSPTPWKRLVATGTDTLAAWPRFLRQENRVGLADSLATTYAVPTWWIVRYVRTDSSLAARAEEWRVRIRPDGVPIDARHIVADSAAGRTLTADQARRVARSALARAGIDTSVLREVNLEETARPARRDVKVTYTDTTVRLPGDATARAWVSLAGDEPLVARRGVELAESFVRDDFGRQIRRVAVAGLFGLVLLGLVIVGAVVVIRRRAPELDDFALAGRSRLTILGCLAALMAASSLNDVPVQMAQYDTAKPWSSFLIAGSIQLVAAAVFMALLLAGLWLTLDALRRRVGVPVWTSARTDSRLSDSVVAGIGLGGVMALVPLAGSVARMMGPPDIARTPETLFAHAAPVLAPAVSVLMSVVSMVPVIAIPLLVILGLSRKPAWRAVAAIVLVTLGAGAAMAVADGPPAPARVIALLVTLTAIVAGLRVWATTSVATWIVAALVAQAVAAVRTATAAPELTTLSGGVLAAIVAVVLVAVMASLEVRTTRAASALAPRA